MAHPSVGSSHLFHVARARCVVPCSIVWCVWITVVWYMYVVWCGCCWHHRVILVGYKWCIAAARAPRTLSHRHRCRCYYRRQPQYHHLTHCLHHLHCPTHRLPLPTSRFDPPLRHHLLLVSPYSASMRAHGVHVHHRHAEQPMSASTPLPHNEHASTSCAFYITLPCTHARTHARRHARPQLACRPQSPPVKYDVPPHAICSVRRTLVANNLPTKPVYVFEIKWIAIVNIVWCAAIGVCACMCGCSVRPCVRAVPTCNDVSNAAFQTHCHR